MAKTTGLGMQFAVGGYSLGGDVQALTRIGGGPASPLPGTDITQSAQARICSLLAADGVAAGIYEGAMEASCYFDPAANASHAVFSALPTSSALYTMAMSGTVLGTDTANILAKQINYDGTRGQDGSFMLAVGATESDGEPLYWGKGLTTWQQNITGAGNLTSFDQGSVSPGAYGAVLHLQVFGVTGTSCTLKLQDSTDNVTFNDVTGGAFAAATTARTWQKIETGNININRYVRLNAAGTFTSCVVFASIHRRNALKSS